MKKVVALLIALPFLFCACSHLDKRPVPIAWPESFDYMEAICEIDVMLKSQQYSGEMSLKVEYPASIFLEIYGPFGNTVLSINRSGDSFIMHADNEDLTDEGEFYRLFRIRIDDIIEDLTFKGPFMSESGIPYKQRENYKVFYYTENNGNKMCWKGREGDFCIKFLDVNFSKGELIGKSDRRGE